MTRSSGIEYSPSFARGLDVSLNYSDVDGQNEIDAWRPLVLMALPFVTQSGIDSLGFAYGMDAEDTIVSIDGRAVNMGSQSIANYDVVVKYIRETHRQIPGQRQCPL